jgi:tetratricopeptide (TPR) repeat protein
MRPSARSLLLVLTVVQMGLSGCATIKRMALNTDDIAVKQAQRTADAVQAFETQRDFAQFQAAQAGWREGNLKACRESLDQILERNPKFYEAQLLYAEVLLSQEKYDDAKAHLELALAEKSDDARSQHMMGLLLQAQGNAAEALVYYRRAAELDPENEQYEQSCQAAVADSAERQVRHDQPAGTDAVPRKLPQPTEKAVSIDAALGDAERALVGGDLDKARVFLSKAVSLDAASPHTPVRAGVLALRYEQPELAIQVLKPAQGRFPDSAALERTLAMAQYRKGDFAAAQTSLEHALSLDKSHALSYLLMGCTLEKLGQTEAAGAHLDQARRLDPRLNVRP